jgi:hypothetical protein
MNRIILIAAAALSMGTATAALAYEYNAVPAGDAQYAQCRSYSTSKYSGGDERSPIAGQSKVAAFCTCMWNETPDNFRGNLAAFAETSKGATINKTCEKYSDWSSD